MARRPRSRVVMGSLLLHGMAIAMLWGVLTGEPQQVEVEDAPVIAIDLVALAQSAPPAAGQPSSVPNAQPAEPQPATPVPPVVQQPQAQAPRPRAEPRPRVEPMPAPAPTPRVDVTPETPTPPAPTSQPTSGQTATNAQSAQAIPQPTGGGGKTDAPQTANASAIAKASYARLVLARLQRAIVYPRRAQRRDIEGVVRVEIVLEASGALRTVRLLETSGSTILDEAALTLVRRVAPFPAVPRDLSPGGQDVAFNAPIQYRLN